MRRAGLAAAVLAACLLAALAHPSAARAATVTTSEFGARLDRAESLLATRAVETTAGALSAADAVDAGLPPDLAVVEGTRTVPVGPAAVAGLTSMLREATTPFERRTVAGDLLARISSMRTALGTPATVPSDPAALRELLAAMPETGRGGEDVLGDRIAKLIEAFAKWLDGLFPPRRGAAPTGGARALQLLVIAVPVLLALLVLGRALLKRRKAAGPVARVPGAAVGGPVVEAAADLPPDAAAYADQLATGGRYRDAVRALYGGAARHLADTGAVRRMRTRTNLEMLRDVRAAAPDLAPVFGDLTRAFESAWYGHADPGDAGYEAAKSAFAEVMAVRAASTSSPGPLAAPPEGGGAL